MSKIVFNDLCTECGVAGSLMSGSLATRHHDMTQSFGSFDASMRCDLMHLNQGAVATDYAGGNSSEMNLIALGMLVSARLAGRYRRRHGPRQYCQDDANPGVAEPATPREIHRPHQRCAGIAGPSVFLNKLLSESLRCMTIGAFQHQAFLLYVSLPLKQTTRPLYPPRSGTR